MHDGLFCWHDRAAWVPLLGDDGSRLREPETALAALQAAYTGLRVFHACRTTDVNTILTEGLRPKRIAELNDVARRLARAFHADVLDGDIEHAIAKVPFSTDGKLYACVDRRQLHDQSHFFKYGSERVFLILKRLGQLNGRDYLEPLGEIGRPTLLELAIPWQDVSEWLKGELAYAITQCWEEVRAGAVPDEWHRTHAQEALVPPRCIIAHYEVPG